MTRTLSQKNIYQLAARWLPKDRKKGPFRIIKDTTDFFRVDYGDVVMLDETPYLIRQNAKEGRFGLDDEVKYWVKRAIDLKAGTYKIIKLVFYEKFISQIAGIKFECFRSPAKEARILDLVAGHNNFMHGFSVKDEKGNIVRVIDLIYGRPLSAVISDLNLDHQTYFKDLFPEILNHFVECIRAIEFLHKKGEKHGDIRRDHIFIDAEENRYRWIDFDFNYRHRENIYGYDLFGLGNILLFLAGKGDVLLFDLKHQQSSLLSSLRDDDLNIVFHNRVANIKKIYPYIPDSLNVVLMHFSKGANWFYENTTQMLEDLEAVQHQLGK
jgi:hypothetical protein